MSKLCLPQCFEFYTGIKVSVVTLMRWHVELKRGITEYVLTLRRLSLNYDVCLDIMMLICIFNNYSLKVKLILLNNPRDEVKGIFQQY